MKMNKYVTWAIYMVLFIMCAINASLHHWIPLAFTVAGFIIGSVASYVREHGWVSPFGKK